MIKLNNIAFSYESDVILKDVSLSIKPGSWIGLVGPNGAGKTTLLKLISGVLNPTSGEIFINGKRIETISRNEMARIIAVVPQVSETLFPFNTLEIVLMGRSPYLKKFGFETEKDYQIAEDAMKKTETWQFRDRPIDQLSGGERQRVFVARALTQKPKILLLDEPTTFLDLKHQLDIMGIVSDLKKSGMTIISAIHDVNLAISYCDKIALLSQGKIFKEGTPTEVITYANLKEIFDSEVYVGTNEFTGKPYYVPMG